MWATGTWAGVGSGAVVYVGPVTSSEAGSIGLVADAGASLSSNVSSVGVTAETRMGAGLSADVQTIMREAS